MDNSFADIQVPAEADLFIQTAIKKGKRHEMMRQAITIAGIIPLMSMLIVIASGFIFPAMAQTLSNIPVIGSIFAKSYDPGLKSVVEKELVDKHNMQMIYDGTTITIKEVYYDNSGISIGYTVQSKNTGIEKSLYSIMLYYDGSPIKGPSISDHGHKVSENEYAYTFSVDYSHQNTKLPETFDLSIKVVTTAEGKPFQETPFNFTVPVSRNKADGSSREFTVMKSFHDKDYSLLVKKVTFTPSTTVLTYDITGPKNKHLFVKVMDENNNVIGPFKSGEYDKDDSISSESETMYMTVYCTPFETIPKKIRLSVFELNGKAYPGFDLEIQ